MVQILKSYAGEGREARLVDFDDHLDDIHKCAPWDPRRPSTAMSLE
jgi:hypothetical protein